MAEQQIGRSGSVDGSGQRWPDHDGSPVMTSGAAFGVSPSQTVGPFLHLALADPAEALVVPVGTSGGIWVRGTVTDGNGDPVADAVVETWQASTGARPVPDGFSGFGRCPTDDDGRWAVHTVKPGPVPGAGRRWEAPHLTVSVFARGLLDRVVTRIYFADEDAANAADPVLAELVEPARRPTLVAGVTEDGYHFAVRLQGEDETVFFAL